MHDYRQVRVYVDLSSFCFFLILGLTSETHRYFLILSHNTEIMTEMVCANYKNRDSSFRVLGHIVFIS